MLTYAADVPMLLPDDAQPGLPLICIVGVDADELAAISAAMHARAALAATAVADWNCDLTPWPAPGLRRGEDFGGGAERTLARLDALLPGLEQCVLDHTGTACSRRFVMGYSLAGLFALWTVTRRDLFDGAGSISGSLWYDELGEYMAANPVRARAAYLSLGDAEPRVRNRRLAQVGAGTQAVYDMLGSAGIHAHFDWNKGNHFTDVPLRIARGADWLCENA